MMAVDFHFGPREVKESHNGDRDEKHKASKPGLPSKPERYAREGEKLKNCKAEGCTAEATEESGYCFMCAEEMACMLMDEGFDPSSAWNAPKN